MSAESAQALIPLLQEKADLLARLVDGLEQPSLHWLSGYAAGLAARQSQTAREPSIAPVADAPSQARLSIVFGSQTGNAKRQAESLARAAEEAGLAVRLLRADAYPLRELKLERLLYVVISTQGDGDPPDDSRSFVEHLTSKRAPRLDDLKFAVLGLGDSSYAKFNAVAAGIDSRLAELGATRVARRGEADVDVETVARPWAEQALSAARDALRVVPSSGKVTALRPLRTASVWNREHPFAAEMLANQRITARGAVKDIRHIELSLRDSGLTYEPGDSLGVWPVNPAALVDEILETTRLDGDAAVTHDAQTLPLREWLSARRELTRLSKPFAIAPAARAKFDDLDALIASPVALPDLLATRQVVDILQAYPTRWDATALVAALRPLTPRLYSIASSLKAVENEAHLTVAKLEYEFSGHKRFGAASNFLAAQELETRLPVFVESNERFRLPRDVSRDVIMIGPGTGVAPFRAFLQERTATAAIGRNWLFFGNPHLRSDFLYQIEWQAALRRGELHRLDVAFSRDQGHKVYVQHNIRQRAKEIYDWLESGAHVYVCGDATHMAKDVHAALRSVVMTQAAKSEEDAEAYLAQLATDRRYSRDVY